MFFLRYQNPILYYHRVGGGVAEPTVTVSEKAFSRQMSLLASGNRVIRLEELVSGLSSGNAALPKKIAVTFDDGYEEIHTKAYSLFKKYKIPVTVFLVTEWIGQKGFLSWEAVREMAGEGVDFGSHTKTHPYLPSLSSRKALEEEIKGSKEILEDRLGKKVTLFSYPVGGFTQEAKAVVENAGYKAAVTTNRGAKGKGQDLYALSRIKMTESSASYWVFKAKTSGYYEQFKRKKKPH